MVILASSNLTLGNAQLHLQIHRCGHHRLGEDQHILQPNHHHQIGKNLSGTMTDNLTQHTLKE